MTKKLNIRSQIHITKICIYGENERKQINYLGDEINHFSLRFFLYMFEEKSIFLYFRLSFAGSFKS